MIKLGDLLYPGDVVLRERANRLQENTVKMHERLCGKNGMVSAFGRLEVKNELLHEIYKMYPAECAGLQNGRNLTHNLYLEPLWSAFGRLLCEMGCGVAFAHVQHSIQTMDVPETSVVAEAVSDDASAPVAGERHPGESAAVGAVAESEESEVAAVAAGVCEASETSEVAAVAAGVCVGAAVAAKPRRRKKAEPPVPAPSAGPIARSRRTAAARAELQAAAAEAAASVSVRLGEAKAPTHNRAAVAAAARLGAAAARQGGIFLVPQPEEFEHDIGRSPPVSLVFSH